MRAIEAVTNPRTLLLDDIIDLPSTKRGHAPCNTRPSPLRPINTMDPTTEVGNDEHHSPLTRAGVAGSMREKVRVEQAAKKAV